MCPCSWVSWASWPFQGRQMQSHWSQHHPAYTCDFLLVSHLYAHTEGMHVMKVHAAPTVHIYFHTHVSCTLFLQTCLNLSRWHQYVNQAGIVNCPWQCVMFLETRAQLIQHQLLFQTIHSNTKMRASYLVIVEVNDCVIVSILITIGEHAGPVTNARLNVEFTVHSTSSLPGCSALLTENTGISPVADSDLTETSEVSCWRRWWLRLSTGSIRDRVLCCPGQIDNTGCSDSGEDSWGIGVHHGESSSTHANELITHDVCGTRAIHSDNDPDRCASCLGKNVIPLERTTTARRVGVEDLAQISLWQTCGTHLGAGHSCNIQHVIECTILRVTVPHARASSHSIWWNSLDFRVTHIQEHLSFPMYFMSSIDN